MSWLITLIGKLSGLVDLFNKLLPSREEKAGVAKQQVKQHEAEEKQKQAADAVEYPSTDDLDDSLQSGDF